MIGPKFASKRSIGGVDEKQVRGEKRLAIC